MVDLLVSDVRVMLTFGRIRTRRNNLCNIHDIHREASRNESEEENKIGRYIIFDF